MQLLNTIEELKQSRPDLMDTWNGKSKEELLEELFKESMDAINAETRVSFLMNEFTNLSKTNYTIEALETICNDAKKEIINEFCWEQIDEHTDEIDEEEIRKRAREFNI